MGTLELKWGPNGDPKTEKGPHGDRVPQMGTHVGTVQIAQSGPELLKWPQVIKMASARYLCSKFRNHFFLGRPVQVLWRGVKGVVVVVVVARSKTTKPFPEDKLSSFLLTGELQRRQAGYGSQIGK